jgi:rubrerythrin
MIMENMTNAGMNRTGIDMSPLNATRMTNPPARFDLKSSGNGKSEFAEDGDFMRAHDVFIREAGPIGTVPVPATFKGLTKTLLTKLQGKRSEVLIDKLSERAAFERTGARLYDMLLEKFQHADMPSDVGFSLSRIRQIRNEEVQHFLLLSETIKELGADPTAQTPAADTVGVLSTGLLQVLSDPRTNIQQCLEAILVAELSDNDGWQLLIKIAAELELNELAGQFQQALEEEGEHLLIIRGLLNGLVLKDAKTA